MRNTHGFSLIELAIVLVILSLLLGSVVVGRDLVHSAAIRATVSQVEKYNVALDVFRKKYGYLPGDIPPTTAGNLGFFTRTGGDSSGNGNGLLEGCSVSALDGSKYNGCGEPLVFWRHLTDAALIDGNYGTSTAGNALDASTGRAALAIPPASAATLTPPARLGHNNFFTTYSAGGFNYYAITGITAMTVPGQYTFSYAVTPAEALSIDEKMDDGLPMLGMVNAITTEVLGTLDAAGTASGCLNGSNQYATDDSITAEQPHCALGLRFQ